VCRETKKHLRGGEGSKELEKEGESDVFPRSMKMRRSAEKGKVGKFGRVPKVRLYNIS